MSKNVRLAGKLPGDEGVDGIGMYAEELCDRWSARNPENPASVLIIGVARVRKFETVDTGEGVHRVPTIEITRLEGKAKLSQNKEARDIQGAGEALDTLGQHLIGNAMLAATAAKGGR